MTDIDKLALALYLAVSAPEADQPAAIRHAHALADLMEPDDVTAAVQLSITKITEDADLAILKAAKEA